MNDTYDEFEERLLTLRPKPPSDDLRRRIERDLEPVDAGSSVTAPPVTVVMSDYVRRPAWPVRGRSWATAATAASVLLAAGVGWVVYQNQERFAALVPREGEKAKTEGAPAAADKAKVEIKPKAGPERAGWFSNPELPDHPKADQRYIHPDVAFTEVSATDAEIDEVLGGLPGFITGKVRNTGRDALPFLELQVVRYARGPNGQWDGQRVRPVAVEVLPSGLDVEFRIRTKFKKAEMPNFVIMPILIASTRGVWSNLTVCDEKGIKIEAHGAAAGGKDRIILSGWVRNDNAKTVAEYRVQVDLYDARDKFVAGVQYNWSHQSEGATFGPGTRRDWEIVTTDFRLADLKCAKARAICRIE